MFLTKCKSLIASAALVGCLGGGAILLAGPVEPVSTFLEQQDRPAKDRQTERKQGEKPAYGTEIPLGLRGRRLIRFEPYRAYQ